MSTAIEELLKKAIDKAHTVVYDIEVGVLSIYLSDDEKCPEE